MKIHKAVFRTLGILTLSSILVIIIGTNSLNWEGYLNNLSDIFINSNELSLLKNSPTSFSAQDPTNPSLVNQMDPQTAEDLAGDSLSFKLYDSSNNEIDFLSVDENGAATNSGAYLKIINNSQNRSATIKSVTFNNPQNVNLNFAHWDAQIDHPISDSTKSLSATLTYSTYAHTTTITEVGEVVVTYTISDVYDGDTNNLKVFTQKTYIPIQGRVLDNLVSTHTLSTIGGDGAESKYAWLKLDTVDSLPDTVKKSNDFSISPTYTQPQDSNIGTYEADIWVNTDTYPTFDSLNELAWTQVYNYNHKEMDGTHLIMEGSPFSWYISVNNPITIDLDGISATGNNTEATVGSGDDAITVHSTMMDNTFNACNGENWRNSCNSNRDFNGIRDQSQDSSTIKFSGKIPESSGDNSRTLTVTIPLMADNTGETSGATSLNKSLIGETYGTYTIILHVRTYTNTDKQTLRNAIDTKTSVIDYSNYDNLRYYDSIKTGKIALANIQRTQKILSDSADDIDDKITGLEAGVFGAKNIIEQNHIQKIGGLNTSNNQTETIYRVYNKNATYTLPYKDSFKYPTNASQQGKYTNTLTGTITDNLAAEYDYWKIDLSALNAEIALDEAAILDDNYTDESRAALETRKNEIQTDIASLANVSNTPTLQSEIDALTSELRTLRENLVLKLSVVFENWDGTVLETVRIAPNSVLNFSTIQTPSRQKTVEEEFTFKEWEPQGSSPAIVNNEALITADSEYKATYTASPRKYTMSFYNYNSETGENDHKLCEVEVKYGENWSACTGTPTRPQTAQYDYVFTGWSPTIVSPLTTSGSAVPETYVASYRADIRYYNVYFLNYNGDVLQAFDGTENPKLPYGSTPVYSGSTTPSRPSNAQYTYTFNDTWTPEIDSVEGDIEYRPNFNQTTNNYTITFKNYDGTTLESKQVAYGETPTYTGQTPEKPSDSEFDYEFSSWNPAIHSVTCETASECNATYTATFEGHHREYEVKFEVRGSIVDEMTQIVEYGATPQNVSDPDNYQDQRYNYTFDEWRCSFTDGSGTGYRLISDSIIKPTTCIAKYTKTTRQYLVRFYNVSFNERGEETSQYYDMIPATYGEYVTPPLNPTTPSTQNKYYIFDDWIDEQGNPIEISEGKIVVLGNKTYTATYEEHTFKTITFKNEDGTILSEKNDYRDGENPVYSGETPTKPADAQYTYTFSGWTDGENNYGKDEELPVVSSDKTYIATYTSTVNEYTIKFVNEDGAELQSSDVAYGETPEYTGETPTKPATPQYTYTFSGWTPEITAVTGEATYTTTFSETVNQYSVIFYDEDGETVLKEATNYNYGTSATDIVEPATPTKPATPQYTYTFSGWTPEITDITCDVAEDCNRVYTATYSSVVNEYAIRFVNEDGTELQNSNVAYGETPTYNGATPEKETDAQYTYTFDKWSPEITAVTCSVSEDCTKTYTATYTSTVNKYTIKFVNEDGTELQNSEIEYGETPVYSGSTPEKEATAQYTYTFSGWTPEIVSVTGEATYGATYSSTVNKYTITFNDIDGNELQSSEVDYGETPAYTGETPTKDADDTYTYEFTGWSPEITSVTGEATYAPVFEPHYIDYTIIFKDYDGTVLSSKTYHYGETITEPTAPTRESTPSLEYTFTGWDKEIHAVTGHETYTATYEGKAYDVEFKWIENQTYTIGEDKEAVFKIEIAKKFFAHRVEVDGKVIQENKDYIITEGSTVVTLQKSFLDTLAVGIHSLDVYYDDEVVISTTFRIEKPAPDTPDTDGDEDDKKDDDKEDSDKKDDKDSDKNSGSSEDGKNGGLDPDTGFFTGTTDFAKLSIVFPILIVTASTLIIVKKKRINKN
ncbi:hypothetical protein IKG45_00970 [Candidatus Saccharibacteria bacterium]|nr:hypothetical protein [Candidatus Saccharibacteria bacterium]